VVGAVAAFPLRANPKGGLLPERVLEQAFFLSEQVRRDFVKRQAHAAGDIDANRVGDDGVLGRQHAADGQPVADVGIRHQGPGHADGQAHGVVHLEFQDLSCDDVHVCRGSQKLNSGRSPPHSAC
jgi:hypothetical protein